VGCETNETTTNPSTPLASSDPAATHSNKLWPERFIFEILLAHGSRAGSDWPDLVRALPLPVDIPRLQVIATMKEENMKD
jgi:hypothetical protein